VERVDCPTSRTQVSLSTTRKHRTDQSRSNISLCGLRLMQRRYNTLPTVSQLIIIIIIII